MKTKRRLWVVETAEARMGGTWIKKSWVPHKSFSTREKARNEADLVCHRSCGCLYGLGRPLHRVVSYEPSPKVQLKFTGGEVVKLRPSR